MQVYAWEHRELAEGDRLQVRIHDRKNKVATGEFPIIIQLDASKVILRSTLGGGLAPISHRLRLRLHRPSITHPELDDPRPELCWAPTSE